MRLATCCFVLLLVLVTIGGVPACQCLGWTSQSGSWIFRVEDSVTIEAERCCDGLLCYQWTNYRVTIVFPSLEFRDSPNCDLVDLTLGRVEKTCDGVAFENTKRKWIACGWSIEREASTMWIGPSNEIGFSDWGTPQTTANCGITLLVDCE